MVEMELVCKEDRRPMSWYFDTEKLTYFQMYNSGEVSANITGKNLPNPLDIIEMRTRAIEKKQLPAGSRIHADPVTVKLWEHWHAYQER